MTQAPTLPQSRSSLTDDVLTEPPEAPSEETKAAGATDAQRRTKRYRIPPDVVFRATADLPDEERSLMRWLNDYAWRFDIPAGELLKKAGGGFYSGDSVYQFLTGRRTAGLEPMLESARGLRKLAMERAALKTAPFIETTLSKRLFQICDAALAYQKVIFVYGESQIGKSRAFEEYQRLNNHGATVHVEMPACGHIGDFLRELGGKMGLSKYYPTSTLKWKIKECLDERMLLIIDQAHECLQSPRSERLPAPLLYVMELYNAKRCGVVIAGTSVLEQAMTKGVHRKLLRQLGLRGLGNGLKLPTQPTARNLDEFAAAFGLPPATGKARDLQTETIETYALGYWLTILRAGSRIADKRIKEAKATKMTWQHVLDAKAGLDRALAPITDDELAAADDEGGAK